MKFVQSFCLSMGTGQSRDISDIKVGFRIPFYLCRKSVFAFNHIAKITLLKQPEFTLMISLLTGLYGDLQQVFRRWKGAGISVIISTIRIVGLVKIQRNSGASRSLVKIKV